MTNQTDQEANGTVSWAASEPVELERFVQREKQ